jgi:hypothetical protein
MAVQITLNIGDAWQAKLQVIVDRHNATHGTAYTLKDWITFFLKEQTIQTDILPQVEMLQRASQQALGDAIAIKKAELMNGL